MKTASNHVLLLPDLSIRFSSQISVQDVKEYITIVNRINELSDSTSYRILACKDVRAYTCKDDKSKEMGTSESFLIRAASNDSGNEIFHKYFFIVRAFE